VSATVRQAVSHRRPVLGFFPVGFPGSVSGTSGAVVAVVTR
jgi:hypothetical protein